MYLPLKASLCAVVLGLTSLPSPVLRQETGGPPTASARVEGVFVDQDGRTIEGVRVLNHIWPGAKYAAACDPAGHFEITLEWDGKRDVTWYMGSARKKGHAKLEFRTDLRGGQEFDFGKLMLEPGGVLSGEVLDASGAPLAGARLVVVDPIGARPCATGTARGWSSMGQSHRRGRDR